MQTQQPPAAAPSDSPPPPPTAASNRAVESPDYAQFAFPLGADCPAHLPFAAVRGQLVHWGLPRCGGYHGGTLAGEASARAYLKQLRCGAIGADGGMLQHIVLAMAGSLAACACEAERGSVRGQIVGFFSTLEERIQPLTRRLRELESMRWEDLQRDVQAGLEFPDDHDDDVINAEWARRSRSEAARRGWQRRRHESRLRAAPAGRPGGAS